MAGEVKSRKTRRKDDGESESLRRSHNSKRPLKDGGSGGATTRSRTSSSTTTTEKQRPPADLDALREARLTYLAAAANNTNKSKSKSPENKDKDNDKRPEEKMKYEYVKRTRTLATEDKEKEKRRRSRTGSVSVSNHHHNHNHNHSHNYRSDTKKSPQKSSMALDSKSKRRAQAQDKDSEDEYVYRKEERESIRNRTRTTVPTSKHKSKPLRVDMDTIADHHGETRRRAPERRHTEPVTTGSKRRSRHGEQQEEGEEEPSKTTHETEAMYCQSNGPAGKAQRPRPPTIKRSATTTTPIAKKTKPKTEAGTGAGNPSPRKPPSLFSALLLPKPPTAPKLVSCLTCGSDDIPSSESAKLPCTHRMCHSCLKRIFSMSIKDPAHMPPRCCTDQHIDLRHVDKLFDQKFKVLWNRKFEEYKTKNRIYCPARRCGAWIKPHYITVEHGRKVGRCKQCKTRVCGICSQKMHTSRDCPKDPATKAFVEVAEKEGWQRCYNCSAMVELKEGCNHMTCRCMAEFCMLCGLKWKSCDCPWFNYHAVDMRLGEGDEEGDPIRYQQEMDRRRDQIRRDEELARRMQQLGIGIFNGVGVNNNRQADGEGEDAGAGNGNQNFIQQAREALTANYAQAGQAARDLLNGFVMGRENRMPGMPVQMEQMLELLGGGGGGQQPRARPQPQDPAEQEGQDDTQTYDRPEEVIRHRRGDGRPRRISVRRRTAVPDGAGGHRIARDHDHVVEDQNGRRIQDWANSVPVPS